MKQRGQGIATAKTMLRGTREALARLLLACVYLVVGLGNGAAHAEQPTQHKNADQQAEIRQLLALPEEKIDVGLAALIISKEIYHNLDVIAYSRQIDGLVNRAKIYIGNQQEPKQRIRALTEFFFKAEGYSYDKTLGSSQRLENFYLNGTIDTKRGNCSTMPMLYMAVAQRLGYPIYPVAAPDHLFLRYINAPPQKYINIEATSAIAGSPDDQVYIKGLEVNEVALKSGSYMRTMTYRQYLGDLLTTAGVTISQRGDIEGGMRHFQQAIKLNPKFPDYYDLLKISWLQKSKQVEDPELVAEYREQAQLNYLKTQELGFIRPH